MEWQRQCYAQPRPYTDHCKPAALALCAVTAAALFHATHAHASQVSLSDDELRRTSARGFPEDLFDKRSIYASDGLVFEMMGGRGRLLNPYSTLFDADFNIQDVVYNPTAPSIVSDANGNTIVRVPETIGDIVIRYVHMPGVHGPGTGYGDITIRGIDTHGGVQRIGRQ